MSSPMEVSVHDAAENVSKEVSEEANATNSEPVSFVTASSLAPEEDKVLVSVEVCMKSLSTARSEDVRKAVERMLEKRNLSYYDGPVPVPTDDSFLTENVERISICDTDEWVENHKILLFWQVNPVVHVFQLSEDGPGEDSSGGDVLSSFSEWLLPAKEFDGLWESLIYETGLKQRLLRYAASALLFTEKGVDPCLVSWNRIILLHGPPGTGKTSLCKSLAQKLSIRFNSRYSTCQLVEVNAHSLFSKWFSESGKLVAKLFQKIQDMVEEESTLVFVLIDEVESLAAARQAALSGSEPSDSIRVVNALLTQMDRLKSSPNVIILTTSNITTAIDIAFVDRADIKAYVGPPTLQARYEILRSCLQELLRTGILKYSQGLKPVKAQDISLSTGNLSNLIEIYYNNIKDDGTDKKLSQDCEYLVLPNYSTLLDKLHASEMGESGESLFLFRKLLEAAEACHGLSGRALRKLPFLAHAALANPNCCDPSKFLHTLVETAQREVSELQA